MRQIARVAPGALCAGVDEAGRGPLAGPVVAAAVMLDSHQPIDGLADSKTLSAKMRSQLDIQIRARSLCFAVAWADSAEIDSLNILRATMLAMRRALIGLPLCPELILVDGNRCPDLQATGIVCRAEAIVGGDGLEAAIGAASILAKVARDRFMTRQHGLYPQYNFARHKGYPTPEHRHALDTHGSCALHRQTFGPVRNASAGSAG